MPLKVFLTIDTEVYPLSKDWRETGLKADIRRDIYGIVQGGEFGLRYQLRKLQEHNLKATYFVEPLFAAAPEVGEAPLRELVEAIRSAGQDVQLHLHPEWVPHIPQLRHLPHHGLISAYNIDQQAELIEFAKATLQRSGVEKISAFRAGDYAANSGTLSALERNGILFDTSYNSTYLDSTCGLRLMSPISQAQLVRGVCELPVTAFRDSPWHERHFQICACSILEMRTALLQAVEKGWSSVVVVFHSFEMLSNRRRAVESLRVRGEVVRRFEWLCGFLSAHRNLFVTRTFDALNPAEVLVAGPVLPLRGSATFAALRMTEQAWNRLVSALS